MSKPFHFKQFTIHQENAAMKVGTDSVLLGAWADLGDASRILDIGTGTGLLAIMAAQRNKKTKIDAVEIDTLAFKDAYFNIENCPWSDRITLHPVSIFDFNPSYRYDHIISNPPFFNDSLLCPDLHRTTARHCQAFSHMELMQKAHSLLKEGGKFSLVLPLNIGLDLVKNIQSYDFYLSRICHVFPMPQKSAKRLLLEFSTSFVEIQKEELTVEYTHHEYSKEYVRLTENFYLNL